MLFANVYNGLDMFINGNPSQVGTIINTFYPPTSPNQTNMTITLGHTNISWNPQFVGIDQLFGNMTELQASLLIFDVFGKIFQSYSLHLPTDYEHLFEELANGTVPVTDQSTSKLFEMLFIRFLVSAVYYLVACVCPVP